MSRMIRIYGSALSSAGRCLWLLEEIGVPYERLDSKLNDPAGREIYLREVFPGGKVPFLVDGDVRLFESMAINAYLAAKYKPELLPSELHERALVDQWSYWSISNLQPEVLKVMMNTMFLPESARDAKSAEAGRVGSARLLAQLEEALTGEFLVGGRFTLADVNCGSVANLTSRAGLTMGPRVTGWLDRLRARPAYKKAVG
jgi:glutathione S-transferase